MLTSFVGFYYTVCIKISLYVYDMGPAKTLTAWFLKSVVARECSLGISYNETEDFENIAASLFWHHKQVQWTAQTVCVQGNTNTFSRHSVDHLQFFYLLAREQLSDPHDKIPHTTLRT